MDQIKPSEFHATRAMPQFGSTKIMLAIRLLLLKCREKIISLYASNYLDMSPKKLFAHEISGWVFRNIVFGGVIGLAVDAISGGIYRLTPEQVQSELRSNYLTGQKGNDFYIAVVMQPNPVWGKICNLKLIN